MPGSVESLVYCWSFWLGKFNSDIRNMVPTCLMWIVWMERNRRSFEDTEKSLVQLQALCQKTLFDCLRVGASRIVPLSWSLFLLLVLLFQFFHVVWCCLFVCCISLCSPSWTPCICFLLFFSLFNNTLITYQNKEIRKGKGRRVEVDHKSWLAKCLY